jgi:hypothetical protein
VFFAKSSGCESPKRFVQPSNKPSVSNKETTKTTMVTKNWPSKVPAQTQAQALNKDKKRT